MWTVKVEAHRRVRGMQYNGWYDALGQAQPGALKQEQTIKNLNWTAVSR